MKVIVCTGDSHTCGEGPIAAMIQTVRELLSLTAILKTPAM